MEIKLLNNDLLAEFHEFFASEIQEQQLVYKPTVSAKFVEEVPNINSTNLVAIEHGKIVGFANAAYKAETNVGYITLILVAKNKQRQGIGRQLFEALQTKLLTQGAVKLEISFFNPLNLEWLIPDTTGHDHPNAPGVDVSSAAYQFFQKCGFLDVALQNVYHLALQHFQYSDEIKAYLENLNRGGYEFVYYDKAIHQGLEDVFADFGNQLWEKTILDNEATENPLPLLILAKNNTVGGFTGPLDVTSSGRGYFAGIGIHSSHRGNGAGKVLFSLLCEGLKNEGAAFMTLFTGDTNPARKIYEAVGFEIVKSFMVMRKEIT